MGPLYTSPKYESLGPPITGQAGVGYLAISIGDPPLLKCSTIYQNSHRVKPQETNSVCFFLKGYSTHGVMTELPELHTTVELKKIASLIEQGPVSPRVD